MRGMPLQTYILDDNGQPVREQDFDRWCQWFGHPENRVIWRDDLPNDVLASTVFLGIDHNSNLSERGPPLLWETVIFGGPSRSIPPTLRQQRRGLRRPQRRR